MPGAVVPRRFWRSQTTFLAAFLFLALPLIVAIAFSQDLEELYWDRFVGASLRTEMGFETGLLSLEFQGIKYRLFGITSVRPRGAFARAGLRAGDVISQVGNQKTGLAAAVRHGRVAMMFYAGLDSARARGQLR